MFASCFGVFGSCCSFRVQLVCVCCFISVCLCIICLKLDDFHYMWQRNTIAVVAQSCRSDISSVANQPSQSVFFWSSVTPLHCCKPGKLNKGARTLISWLMKRSLAHSFIIVNAGEAHWERTVQNTTTCNWIGRLEEWKSLIWIWQRHGNWVLWNKRPTRLLMMPKQIQTTTLVKHSYLCYVPMPFV